MKKKKSLIIRLKQKINLLKKIKYWLTIDELKVIANSYVNGILHYNILLWAWNNFKLIEKIEKLRIKVIETVVGVEETKNLNREQIFKLFNWTTIEESRRVAENVKIHKIITSKKPNDKYANYMNDRSDDQVKYKYINTKLRSQESYNSIPLNIRNKSIKNFNKAYKIHRNGLKVKPKIVKYPRNSTYTLVWPGS